MLNLIFIFFSISIFSNNTINNDLNIVENDYNNLVFLYNHPFLIKDDYKLVKKLENKININKKSEPIRIKLLSKLYIQQKKTNKLNSLRKKYNIITKFNYLKIKNIKLFEELPIEYIKKKYIQKEVELSQKGYYILETYCKSKNKHSIYFYNDLTNKTYINNKLFIGNKFIINNDKKDKIFKISLKIKLPKKADELIYFKGATCSKKFSSKKVNSNIKLGSIISKALKSGRELNYNFNYNFNYDKEYIEELIEDKTPLSYYKLYNFYLSSNLENRAYKYLKLWRENCNNYDSRKEEYTFYKRYIPSEDMSDRASQRYEEDGLILSEKNRKKNIFNKIDLSQVGKIEKNEILQKNVFVKKINNEYFQYIHYFIAIKNASKFIEYFKIPAKVDLLGVYSIKNKDSSIRVPLSTKFTENEIFLKEIENNMFLEIFIKSKIKDVIFLQEKYLAIKNFNIKFDDGIEYKMVNERGEHTGSPLRVVDIKPYFITPFQANLLDFMPYFIINDIPKEINTLKWYYFYKSLSNLKIPNEMKKINDIKKAYYFFNNKPLIFYKWSKLKKLPTKLLIFHLKNDIYGDKLFNYPIIKYGSTYLDLNLANLSFGKLPKYLKNKEYIEINEKGRYLYKRHEKILKNFVENNKIKIDYKILDGLDFAEFEINIELHDNYRSGMKAMLKKYNNEEIIAEILEIYINTKLKNSSLIDYEIIDKNTMKIYIKGIIKNPLEYFEVNNTEFLKIKNYFSELFTPFFNQSPKLIEYILNNEIIAPIEIKDSYQEDMELNIEIMDKGYYFSNKKRKIQIKTSFYLSNKIINIKEYKAFYKKLRKHIDFRKNLLNNISIKKQRGTEYL